MRKLRLDLDRLVVESFETGNGDGDGRGTVLGRQISVDAPGEDRSPRPTSWRTCVAGCYFQLSQGIRETCVGDCFGWMESQIFTCGTFDERICRGPGITPTRLDG